MILFIKPLREKVDSISKVKGSCILLDIACSYGFNGCIAKYGLPYGKEILRKPQRNNKKCYVVGLDISKNALDYARENYFVDECIHQNLEIEELDDRHRCLVDSLDLVIDSGAFSYVGVETIKKIF